MTFYVTHIYREGNKCADILANTGLSIVSHQWFDQPPANIRANLVTNKIGLPKFIIS